MPIVVQKFGGSSVSSLDKLGTVADLVVETRRKGDSVVVVVSAMGKTTEGLIDLAHQAARAGNSLPGFEPPRRELDMLVSTGERVSMALLSIAIQARGQPAVSFTGSQSGILTNDRHFDARIIEVRPHRIEDELARGHVVIVAGYQGMSYRREITTLGRGGSDTTAVALAAALSAERCEIYSDVDGVYTADPHLVSDARHIPELDYATLSEMAESGARVLNAQALDWARRHRVVIHARRTADFAASGTGRETIVSERQPAPTPRSVVTDSKLAVLAAEASAATALLDAAQGAELPVRDAIQAHGEVLVTVPLTSVPDVERARAALTAQCIPGFRWIDGVGALSTIGIGVGSDPARLARAVDALSVAPLFAVSGPLRLTAVIPLPSLAEAEACWHRLFVSGG